MKGLTNLSNIYLWESKVTADGADKLRKELPEANVNIGEQLKQMAKAEAKEASDKKEEQKSEKPKEEKKEEKKDEKKA